MMQTIFSAWKDRRSGSEEEESIIPIPHGTGCTLSSAIASNLAKGMEMEEAVRKAKEYISKALEAGLDLGKGSGPLDHAFYMANL